MRQLELGFLFRRSRDILSAVLIHAKKEIESVVKFSKNSILGSLNLFRSLPPPPVAFHLIIIVTNPLSLGPRIPGYGLFKKVALSPRKDMNPLQHLCQGYSGFTGQKYMTNNFLTGDTICGSPHLFSDSAGESVDERSLIG